MGLHRNRKKEKGGSIAGALQSVNRLLGITRRVLDDNQGVLHEGTKIARGQELAVVGQRGELEGQMQKTVELGGLVEGVSALAQAVHTAALDGIGNIIGRG